MILDYIAAEGMGLLGSNCAGFYKVCKTLRMNSPGVCGQYKKPMVENIELLEEEASRQRRLSSLCLDILVVKVDIAVNRLVVLRESGWLISVNTL